MDFGFIFSSAAGELFSPTTAAYALATLGLAVHFGYTGLLNFGQAGFMAVGAYGFAISTLTFHVPFFVGLLIAVVCSAIFALKALISLSNSLKRSAIGSGRSQ